MPTVDEVAVWHISIYRDPEDEQVHVNVRVPHPPRPGRIVVNCPKGGTAYTRKVLALVQRGLYEWQRNHKAEVQEDQP